MSQVNALEEILTLIMGQSYKTEDIKEIARRQKVLGINPKTYEKDSYLVYTGQPLRRIIIQLNGSVLALKYTPEGGMVRSGTVTAPQIYGLAELLNKRLEHTANLRAESAVCCITVEPELFLKAVKESHIVALHSLYFLADFTDRMLNRNDMLTLNTPFENLMLYLYNSCNGMDFPVVITDKKAQISESLNINLRTLYRQLDQLEKEKYITRQKGNIVIDKSGYKKIKSDINNIL